MIKNIFRYLVSKEFWRTLLLMLLVSLILIFITQQALKLYSRHGQRILLPDLSGMKLEEAEKEVAKHNFKLLVSDSVHIVNREGGEILNQNPPAFSKVKEDRSIYLTVTKNTADKVALKNLPSLYGKSYERRRKTLNTSYKINTGIAGYMFDPGPSDYILGAIYKGDTILLRNQIKENTMIAKGETIHFILSKRTGGETYVPDLVCMTYEEAVFILSSMRLEVGNVTESPSVNDRSSAYVQSQTPISDGDSKMLMGQSIDLYLSANRPAHCPTDSL
jgi:hypothetical protein